MLLELIEEKRQAIRGIGEQAARRGRQIGIQPKFADQDYARQRTDSDCEHDDSDPSLQHLKSLVHAAE